MKQKHIFLITIDHYEDENRIFTKVVQGPIKRDFETNYVVDDSGNDYWVSKKIFEKFEVVKESYEGCEKPIISYTMGFIWEDGDDEHYVQYMADECQRLCKLPIFDRLNKLWKEINQTVEKLAEFKTCVKI